MCELPGPPGSELKYSVPSLLTEGSVFQKLPETLIGGGRGLGTPQPEEVRSTSQIRRPPLAPLGSGREEAKKIRLPSGLNLGGKSVYSPENGRTAGALH